MNYQKIKQGMQLLSEGCHEYISRDCPLNCPFSSYCRLIIDEVSNDNNMLYPWSWRLSDKVS